MELLITYSPSGKTKYFNVLLESGEILAARTKKAAIYIIETLQNQINEYRNRFTADDDLQNTIADHPETNTYHDIFGSVSKSSRKRARSGISSKRKEHDAPLSIKDNAGKTITRMEQRIRESGESAEEHGKRAEEHGKRAEEHGKRAEEHGKRAEAYGAFAEAIANFDFGFLSDCSEFDRYFGDSLESEVSQQFNDERPMRRIVQVDLDGGPDDVGQHYGLPRLAGGSESDFVVP